MMPLLRVLMRHCCCYFDIMLRAAAVIIEMHIYAIRARVPPRAPTRARRCCGGAQLKEYAQALRRRVCCACVKTFTIIAMFATLRRRCRYATAASMLSPTFDALRVIMLRRC